MTEKRYYTHKHLINEDKVHDKICHRFMNITETVEHMNMYYQKYTALKKENEQLKKSIKRQQSSNEECSKYIEEVNKENEELKAQLKDCEKRVIDKEVEWLRDNTVWEQMPSNRRTFTSTKYHRENDE